MLKQKVEIGAKYYYTIMQDPEGKYWFYCDKKGAIICNKKPTTINARNILGKLSFIAATKCKEAYLTPNEVEDLCGPPFKYGKMQVHPNGPLNFINEYPYMYGALVQKQDQTTIVYRNATNIVED